MNALNVRRLQVHVPVVGWLLVVEHGFVLLAAVLVFLILWSVGFAVEDSATLKVLGIVGTSVGLFLAALSLPGLLAGFGLLARKGWARMLAIVVSFLGMLNLPIGTIIGVYSIWVLLQDGAAEYFGTPSVIAQGVSG